MQRLLWLLIQTPSFLISMATATAPANRYDELPYLSQPVPQSEPDRLAGLARLWGMEPPRADQARILELGCGVGENLIPMADRFPESEFVGVDYSARQVTAGRLIIQGLGLKNATMLHQSIADVGESLGKFDYIISHGVYSWVTRQLQDHILRVCSQSLHPNGVAYVSFNAYPRWHLRDIIRELALSACPIDSPATKRAEEAFRLMQGFSTMLADDPTAYAVDLRREIKDLLGKSQTYLFHEFLEDYNLPVYFCEFAARMAANGLKYLGDAIPAMTFSSNYPRAVTEAVAQVSWDLISAQQHLDLVRDRAFHHAVLCHEAVPLSLHISGARLARLYLAGRIHSESESPDLMGWTQENFIADSSSIVSGSAGKIWTSVPALKLALMILGKNWPQAISFDELVNQVNQLLTAQNHSPLDDQGRENLATKLAHVVTQGGIDILSGPSRFVSTPSERPLASRVARWQASMGADVTTQRHEYLRLDPLSLRLLPHLNGQNDRASLQGIMAAAAARGEITLYGKDGQLAPQSEIPKLIEQVVQDSLQSLAGHAMLIA